MPGKPGQGSGDPCPGRVIAWTSEVITKGTGWELNVHSLHELYMPRSTKQGSVLSAVVLHHSMPMNELQQAPCVSHTKLCQIVLVRSES